MSHLNKQSRRLELLETKADEFGRFKTAAALELKALAQKVADLEKSAQSMAAAAATEQAKLRLHRVALTGSWRERREARKALR